VLLCFSISRRCVRHGLVNGPSPWTSPWTSTPSLRYLITYLVRRDPRVELRPDLLWAERISSSAELALRFYFLVRVENLVDLGAR